jgi:hypothetical protein
MLCINFPFAINKLFDNRQSAERERERKTWSSALKFCLPLLLCHRFQADSKAKRKYIIIIYN